MRGREEIMACGMVGFGLLLGSMGGFGFRGLGGMGRFAVRWQADFEFARANPCNLSLQVMHHESRRHGIRAFSCVR